MKRSTMILLLLCFVTTQILTVTSIKSDFDFFFFVQHWPGADDGDIAQSSSASGSSSSKEKPSTTNKGKPSTSNKGKPGSNKGKQAPKKKTTTEAPEESFGIHGLWPQLNDGTIVSKCDPKNKHPFELSMIADLTAQLKKHWHSLASPNKDGEETWKHEWVKHGTCSLSSLDQRGYFESALRLKKRVNILQLLVNAGVNPNGSPYQLERILTPLIEGMEYMTPGIECNSKGELYQVYICVDKPGSNFINCPVYPRIKNCDTKNIIFPRFGDHRHANDEP